ncbi:Zn(II)2Cys6 transcription factor domain-containing protein [Aspergillus aculeatinus CBS 121060]|uniref:Uncharacterized protein n=1 Tax=Aspergillus aculeatinus CBS 121060 TaxID=1448322 RepID=A0ACD1HPX0_9EURO|nr:hypothetical protein BO66DRAFT_8935 [Aspergillus aculeatinus CBS 121060]RAH75490.1 hypothetical protein BO66DRAFT_8935 [Aspergillus aculeatinus CBS 121060]
MGNYSLGGEVHLSSLQAETIVYPAAKRYACDRCRTQKLRCPREQQGLHDPCARCIRAGVECVTSDAKPLGRPSRSDHRSIPPSRRQHPQHPQPPQPPQPPQQSMDSIQTIEILENDNGITPSAIPPCIDPTTNQTMAEGWDNAFLQWNHQNGFSLGPHDHHLNDTTMLDGDTAPINSDLALAFPPLATDTPSLTPPSASAWVDPAEPLQFPDREEDAVRRLASLAGSLQALLARTDPSL